MFEAAAIIYLWAIGAWGHYDIYASTPAWETGKTEWLAVMCCLFWPLIIPLVLVGDLIEWARELRT